MTATVKIALEVALDIVTAEAARLLGVDANPRTLQRVQKLLVIAKALRRQIVSDTKISKDERDEVAPRDPMDGPVPPPPFEEEELLERELGFEEEEREEMYARPYRMRNPGRHHPGFGPDLQREEDLAKILRIEAARRRDEAETRVAKVQELLHLRHILTGLLDVDGDREPLDNRYRELIREIGNAGKQER